ncbi:MAG: hypothetical protein Q6373_004360 [Candidatus Sigynarchaeota archaeon]
MAGGSGHLGFTSMARFDVGKPRDARVGNQAAIEVPFTIETCTETEFLQCPENEAFSTKKHAGAIALDASMNVLGFKSE